MKISNAIEIQAPPEKVFFWLEDPDRAMKWMKSVTEYEVLNKTQNMVGTTFHEYVEENGQKVELHGIVTKFISNEIFAVHLESDYNSVDVCFTLKNNENRTQLIQNIEIQFKGRLRLFGIFLSAYIKKKIKSQTQKEFAQLKDLCEQNF